MKRAVTGPATAIVVAALVLSACSGSDAETSTVPTPPPETTGSSTSPWDGRITNAPTTRDLSTHTEPFTPPSAPTGRPGQPRGLPIAPETVDVTDVDQVAEAFALTMLTPDTALDLSPADVDRRAARWATDEYAATLTKPRKSSGGTAWIALAADQGYVEAELLEHPAARDGLITAPSARDLTAERPYVAALTPQHTALPEEQTSVIVYLTRTGEGQPWQVWDFYQEGGYERGH